MTDTTASPSPRRIPWDALAVAPFIIFAVMFLFLPTLGIVGAAWFAVRLQVARIPDELGWRDIAGVGVLTGIGFTVALFITELAFHEGASAEQAKVGILAASALAGIGGYKMLRFFRREKA